MAVWLFQMSFTIMILVDAYEAGALVFEPPSDTKIAFARFAAGMLMQTITDEEIRNGHKMMKYSVNHWWKFKHHRVAFTVGFLQTFALTLITIVNYFVVMISGSVIDVMKDFTALLIIADFDNIFGDAFEGTGEIAKDIIDEDYFEELFKIETTTSLDAV